MSNGEDASCRNLLVVTITVLSTLCQFPRVDQFWFFVLLSLIVFIDIVPDRFLLNWCYTLLLPSITYFHVRGLVYCRRLTGFKSRPISTLKVRLIACSRCVPARDNFSYPCVKRCYFCFFVHYEWWLQCTALEVKIGILHLSENQGSLLLALIN